MEGEKANDNYKQKLKRENRRDGVFLLMVITAAFGGLTVWSMNDKNAVEPLYQGSLAFVTILLFFITLFVLNLYQAHYSK